ncbi:MerR family transcriptional regulator, redox-sensitive transcriptional activator SoxR [Aliiroseovarius crassostreae]|uniref:Transcriptional regulator n=1 Tax=Aliiroseovarius crassostreae TaxID=154981 RepID=A0A0P7JKL6_9RHOB|nr:redox-sensitive transcriptional activator SoxR [Aliiroseovarius crassostreae]KPN61637.1 transcriptional regulator [Aliiroseovarius crassostreae]SFU56103.1 MerR family transcriptional regulator, redox-sensitive transcriptional activator SoxR [Aliiroseovarius crassostreae]
MERRNEISIGTLANRTGLAVSAIRYYETQGLVAPERNAGGQRRFLRSDIRRLSFVMIAQKFGFSLDRIREVLGRLPKNRTPTAKDWTVISQDFRAELDEQIAALTRLRDKLDGCIGCGCLSLDRCALYNPDDVAADKGAGPRYLMGDEAVRPEE